jgi:predicted MFS family arabinose efflux permease
VGLNAGIPGVNAVTWSKTRIAAVSCGVSVLVVLNTLPMLTGQLATGLKLGAGQLGIYASSETVALALGSLAAALGMRYLSPRSLAAGGLALLFCADIASYGTESFFGLTAARGLGGFGAGAAQSACFYVYGLAHRERTFAGRAVVSVHCGGFRLAVDLSGVRGAADPPTPARASFPDAAGHGGA